MSQSDRPLLSEGVAPFFVKSVAHYQSKAGNHLIRVIIQAERDGQSTPIFEFFSSSPKAKPFISRFLASLGEPEADLFSWDDEALSRLKGREGQAKIYVEQSQEYPDSNRVHSWLPNAGGQKKPPLRAEKSASISPFEKAHYESEAHRFPQTDGMNVEKHPAFEKTPFDDLDLPF